MLRFDPSAHSIEAFALEAEAQYKKEEPIYERAIEKVRRLIIDVLKSAGIRVAAVESRVKSPGSFRRKVAKADPQNPTLPKYCSPLTEIQDKLGLRIVTYLIEEIPHVVDQLQKDLNVRGNEAKIKGGGYRSVHVIADLGPARSALREYSEFGDRVFEIQVRTVLQHAWAEIEHDLGYKALRDAPGEIGSRFQSLAGLLEIADREFQSLQSLAKKNAREIEESIEGGKASNWEITTSVLQYVVDKEFGVVADLEVLGAAAESLRRLGYSSLSELSRDIASAKSTQAYQRAASHYSDPIVQLYAAITIQKGIDAVRRVVCDSDDEDYGWEPFFDSISSFLD